MDSLIPAIILAVEDVHCRLRKKVRKAGKSLGFHLMIQERVFDTKTITNNVKMIYNNKTQVKY